MVNDFNPLVSAVISTYNSEKFIRGRIENLLEQTIIDKMEIIVVNSGSQENEEDIIKEYLSLYNNIIYLKSEERETIYKAWNKGIKHSSGLFITNANTDDRLRKDALEIMSNYLYKNLEIGIIYSDQYVTSVPNDSFLKIKQNKIQRWNNFKYERLLEASLTGPQPMWRASIHFKKNIWFNEELEIAGDYDFACKVGLKYKLYHLPKVLGIYYLSPNSENKEYQDIQKTFNETYKIKNEYSFKYLKQLAEKDLYQIYKHYTKWTKKSFIIFYAWKILLKFFNPNSRLPTRQFTFWFASRIKHYVGDLGEAKSLCKKFLIKKKYKLIEYQLNDLEKEPKSVTFVSVIIPTHNRPTFLKEALQSLVIQTYKNFEVIIVNNGTVEVDDIVNEFSPFISIKYLHSDILGSVSHAKNIAIQNSSGNYIAFLDDDDWYHPEHLETLIFEMKKENHLIAYTDALVEFQNEKNGKFKTVKKFIEYSRDFNKKLILIKDYIFAPCIMLNKKCFDTVGLFDENLKTDEDMDLWIRMSKYYNFKHIKKVTCSVRRTNSVEALTKNWELMYKNALYLYKKHRPLSKYNLFVLAGQLYYLNLRKNRARKYKNDSFNYNY